jgi:uncharacterized DUF497 family protein
MDEFEWDPAKAGANWAKHGIRLADATAVFRDERALSRADDHVFEERKRYEEAS